MTRHVTSYIQAEHPPSINLVVSTRLAVYNSKSSKPNRSASTFRRKALAMFKSSQPASSMAQFFACCSAYQNPYDGEDKLAGRTHTEGSNRCTPAPATTRAFTLAVSPVIVPLVFSGSADSSVVKYLKDDLQQILRTVLDSRLPSTVPVPVVAAAPQYKGPYERPLKTWFPDIYWGKSYLECYNFF